MASMAGFVKLILFAVTAHQGCCQALHAAPNCPVIYNCPCKELIDGCYRCPCEGAGSTVQPSHGRLCPYVHYAGCPEGCLKLDNSTQCFVCNCTVPQAALLECYDCPATLHTSLCKTVSQCQQGEQCYAERTTTSVNTTYTFSCKAKEECDRLSPPIIGRRSSRPPQCSGCCQADWCNHDLCK